MSRTKIIKKHFTLVEILVAMALFMMAIAPLLGVLMRTTKVHTDNMKRIKAQMLAKDELARFTLYKNNTEDKFNGVNSILSTMTVNTFTKHPKYTGLYYKVDGDQLTDSYNLVLFTLTIGYTRTTYDEIYYLYVARDE